MYGFIRICIQSLQKCFYDPQKISKLVYKNAEFYAYFKFVLFLY
jgi:hypothetical protein